MQFESGTGLSPAEAEDLRRLAGLMIPVDEVRGMPGADDPLIFGDIVRSLGRDAGDVRAGLAALSDQAGGSFGALDQAAAEQLALGFMGRTSRETMALGRAVLQCYYRDDRVLQALGLEARAPFPLGHKVEQGDWSLLDPVRRRPKLWRDDREA